MKDWQSISESPFYEKANAYVEETHNNDCTLEAFIDGAESRQAEIAELEAQIDKMKCCEMCKHKNINWDFSPICEIRNKIKIENPLTCKCEKWEIKEK